MIAPDHVHCFSFTSTTLFRSFILYAEIFVKMSNKGLAVSTAKLLDSKYLYVITQIQHKMSNNKIYKTKPLIFKPIMMLFFLSEMLGFRCPEIVQHGWTIALILPIMCKIFKYQHTKSKRYRYRKIVIIRHIRAVR